MNLVISFFYSFLTIFDAFRFCSFTLLNFVIIFNYLKFFLPPTLKVNRNKSKNCLKFLFLFSTKLFPKEINKMTPRFPLSLKWNQHFLTRNILFCFPMKRLQVTFFNFQTPKLSDESARSIRLPLPGELFFCAGGLQSWRLFCVFLSRCWQCLCNNRWKLEINTSCLSFFPLLSPFIFNAASTSPLSCRLSLAVSVCAWPRWAGGTCQERVAPRFACLISTQGIRWHEACSVRGKRRVWGAIRICWHAPNTKTRRRKKRRGWGLLLVWEGKVACGAPYIFHLFKRCSIHKF